MSTTATTGTSAQQRGLGARLAGGAIAGLAGGVIFGVLMQMMGMIGMIGMLVGSSSTAVAWLVHLVVSAVIGAGFGLTLGGRATSLTLGVGAGLVYGAVWWVLGPLLLMPAKLGMPVFAINAAAWKSLMGHLIFGAVTGLVYAARRRHG